MSDARHRQRSDPQEASGTRRRFEAVEALLAAAADDRTSSTARSFVLVVEDEDAIRDALGILLGDDYDVACVERLAKARSVLASPRRPALIVLDLTLEGEHGGELLAELSETEDAPPVLVLSASRDAGEWARAYGVPFMKKPFDVVELLAAVADAIRARARPSRPSATPG